MLRLTFFKVCTISPYSHLVETRSLILHQMHGKYAWVSFLYRIKHKLSERSEWLQLGCKLRCSCLMFMSLNCELMWKQHKTKKVDEKGRSFLKTYQQILVFSKDKKVFWVLAKFWSWKVTTLTSSVIDSTFQITISFSNISFDHPQCEPNHYYGNEDERQIQNPLHVSCEEIVTRGTSSLRSQP